MKILVACEESQVVCKAFRAKGHEAYSCDIQDCSGGNPELHIIGDAITIAENGYSGIRQPCSMFTPWDMVIAHPPCTYLCNSGVSWLYNKDKSINHARWNKMTLAGWFFKRIAMLPCDKIAIENPIPHRYAVKEIGRKYDQIVQPWMFGHMERKATCLWLKGLPKLTETNNVKEEMLKLPKREQQRLHYLPPSKDRAKLRSKTYQGIADAMAEQWGTL